MAALGFVCFLSLVALFRRQSWAPSPSFASTRDIYTFRPCPISKRTGKIPSSIKTNSANGFPKTSSPKIRIVGPFGRWCFKIHIDASARANGRDSRGNPTGAAGEPNCYNLMGTNQAGVDVFAQMVHGTRVALLVGFVATGIAALIGITVGSLAGYFGGWVDMLLSRLIEVVMCIPALVLILALLAILESPTIWHLMAVLGATGWTGIARLTRGEFLKLRRNGIHRGRQIVGRRAICGSFSATFCPTPWRPYWFPSPSESPLPY